MSLTRTELIKWLGLIDVKGETLDVGGGVWSMKNQVKSFEGKYSIIDEHSNDLNKTVVGLGTFDNIFATEVMQFIYNPIRAVSNFKKLLNDGGRLFLSFHLTHPPMKGHDYFRYTEQGVFKLLEDFEIDEFSEPVDGYYLVQCSQS